MADAIILCTDGSDASLRALEAGLSLVGAAPGVEVVTVIEASDPSLVTGTGFAGGTMSPEDFDEQNRRREGEGETMVRDVAARLGLVEARTTVLLGSPGPALCDHATEPGARAIVLGTRGRGGLKRAVLGSVSDHVVRNAPCPVVVTGESNRGS
ncbi:MAG: universal stress protein [Actinomycetota bacterium]|nr:universal stress protein [Actinomycetota bacterium]